MHLKPDKDGFSLVFNAKEKSLLKEIPIGRTFPKRPLLIQNVMDRLGITGQAIQPLKPRAFPEAFLYHTQPLPHQHDSLSLLWTYRGLNLLLDPGLGKTKILLDYIHLRKPRRTLVVCPSPLKGVWEEERDRHRPELTLTRIDTKDDELKGEILLMSYAMLRLKLEQLFFWKPELIIVDEALIQNDSLTTSALITLGKLSKERILASGSLVNNGPLNLYYPLQFSEPSLVGGSFGRFRDRYVETYTGTKWNSEGTKTKYTVATDEFKNIPELRSMVRATSIIMRKEEVLKDLPKQHFYEIDIEMPQSYKDIWATILGDAVIDVPGHDLIELENPLAIVSRLSQLTAGFFYMEGKVPWFLDEQPKLDVLIKKASASRERGIIWIKYNAQSLKVEERLAEAGIEYMVVNGRTKDVPKDVRTFNNSDSKQFLVAQERVLNYGHTVLGHKSEDDYLPLSSNVKEQHFLTESYSYQVTTQQIGRTHRIGVTYEPEYYRYLMSPLDLKVRAVLDTRRDVSDTILEHFLHGQKAEKK
jgi:hypothetical protein